MRSKTTINSKKKLHKKVAGDSVLVIRRSCLTGKAVWLGRAKNKRVASAMYCRAKKAERLRQRKWKGRVERLRKWMTDALNNFLSELPITQELTPAQIEHIRAIQTLAQEEIPCDREFYEHILATDKRKREDKAATANRRTKLNKRITDKDKEQQEGTTPT